MKLIHGSSVGSGEQMRNKHVFENCVIACVYSEVCPLDFFQTEEYDLAWIEMSS